MKVQFSIAALFFGAYFFAQTDSTKHNAIKEVSLVAKKPTIENKTDRTVFNVANSSILAGNTTWDILRMTPLVSIDNSDVIRAEGEMVTVYINDRKTVFNSKELKEYLKTIPAERLMKIEVITSPSARYETSGEVINIVLKKLENEGLKGSVTLTNTQQSKNSQYSNINLNYHRNKFTQTLTGSYSDNTYLSTNNLENSFYADNSVTKIINKNTDLNKSPSASSSSEVELNDKNTVGFIFEYAKTDRIAFANAEGNTYIDNSLTKYYTQNQYLAGINQNIGSNLFYKFYDKEKNTIFDVNLGINYYSVRDSNDHVMLVNNDPIPNGNQIVQFNQNREYFLKFDYTRPIGKTGNFEIGGKIDFRNNDVPYDYYNLTNSNWVFDGTRSNDFHYLDNINSLYGNFSQTFFKKLETRIGLRYEYITYKIKQDVGNIEKSNQYGVLLPDLLVKYSFSDNYNLSATYRHNVWRPFYSEFNPFLLPLDNGTFYRGNMDLQPNPSDRFGLKLGLYKKYYLSASYYFTNKDYWDTYVVEDGKTINTPMNFDGRIQRYNINANTNQTFFKNKLNINVNIGFNYSDKSDFNEKNNLANLKSYLTNFDGSANISYTNLFNKNINLNGWFGLYTQNVGNMLGNKSNFFSNITITKLFPKTQMEASMQLMNIFKKPNFDVTTYSPIGTFRNNTYMDWHGVTLTFIKRFGNQKVKENSKTDVEKQSNGSK